MQNKELRLFERIFITKETTRRVLALRAQGWSNWMISLKLNLSPKKVCKIFKKEDRRLGNI